MKKKIMIYASAALLAAVLLAAAWHMGSDKGGDTREEAVCGQPAAQQEILPGETAEADTEVTEKEEPQTEEETDTADTAQEQKPEKQEPETKPAVSSGSSTASSAGKEDSRPAPAEEKPAEEPRPAQTESQGPACTISVSCATVLQNIELCDSAKRDYVPADGWILKTETVTFSEGETVMDVLSRVCREREIPLEYTFTPMYNSAYIEGIGNLYEFDVGELSGWMYSVNGEFPNFGCSAYTLKNGDTVCWVYTCDLGRDVGGGNAAQR